MMRMLSMREEIRRQPGRTEDHELAVQDAARHVAQRNYCAQHHCAQQWQPDYPANAATGSEHAFIQLKTQTLCNVGRAVRHE